MSVLDLTRQTRTDGRDEFSETWDPRPCHVCGDRRSPVLIREGDAICSVMCARAHVRAEDQWLNQLHKVTCDYDE